MLDLEKIVRPNIRKLTPYSSARKEFKGTASIFLDANENSLGSPIGGNYNRYPDPLQLRIKKRLAGIFSVDTENIFLGNGSDEAIDLLFRIFCEPRIDNILIFPPTYGMYEVSAGINDVEVRRRTLDSEFQITSEDAISGADANTRLAFFCTPNNPTGNSLRRTEILEFARQFNGIVVVDEAYGDFSAERSFVGDFRDHPNLVVLRTFSKAWGLAGLRVGMAFASTEVISLFNRVKPPYNISQIAQEGILTALDSAESVGETTALIVNLRDRLAQSLGALRVVEKVYPSDANFILVKTEAADRIYGFLINEGIVVRNRNTVELCGECLRITVGTEDENQRLLKALERYEKSIVY